MARLSLPRLACGIHHTSLGYPKNRPRLSLGMLLKAKPRFQRFKDCSKGGPGMPLQRADILCKAFVPSFLCSFADAKHSLI